jgi:nucleotide-binding universal stress UspA family protein
MIRRILVPLDGSKRAEEALKVAVPIARANDGALLLVQVVTAPVVYGPYGLGGPSVNALYDEEEAAASTYLQQVIASPDLAGLVTEPTILIGAPAQTIITWASDAPADLIVLTSHGHTGPGRWALGSVTQHVVRHAPTPVLVVNVTDEPTQPAKTPSRLLVSLDGSPLAEQALAPAIEVLAALSGSGNVSLHLLEVVDWDLPAEQAAADQVLKLTREYLASVATRVESVHADVLRRPVTWQVAVDHDAATKLIHVMETGEGAEPPGPFDLMAMATHGRSGIMRWALGSTTERVLASVKHPLLIVRAKESAS